MIAGKNLSAYIQVQQVSNYYSLNSFNSGKSQTDKPHKNDYHSYLSACCWAG